MVIPIAINLGWTRRATWPILPWPIPAISPLLGLSSPKKCETLFTTSCTGLENVQSTLPSRLSAHALNLSRDCNTGSLWCV
uniref:Uncharacterized protein n=1 Tax=Magallana gigas TaxID=29159 RepID=K1Q798_MAGGI